MSSFSVAPRCPNCQQPISKDKIVNDTDLQREIQSFEIYCVNKDKGCTWDGILRDFQVHLETCGFIAIDCPNGCNARFERRFMNKHQNQDCPKRTISCEFCMKRKFFIDKKNYFHFFLIKVKQILYLKMKSFI